MEIVCKSCVSSIDKSIFSFVMTIWYIVTFRCEYSIEHKRIFVECLFFACQTRSKIWWCFFFLSVFVCVYSGVVLQPQTSGIDEYHLSIEKYRTFSLFASFDWRWEQLNGNRIALLLNSSNVNNVYMWWIWCATEQCSFEWNFGSLISPQHRINSSMCYNLLLNIHASKIRFSENTFGSIEFDG